MAYSDDPEAYRERLEAKLQPERIRATLAFSGLYQLTHQLIQSAVLDQVKQFFGKSPLDDTWWHGGAEYRRDVLGLHKVPFKASLLWLQKMDAISAHQADRLDDIYRHRNDLSHELAKYIVDVDVDFEPDTDLFLEALAILRDVHRFWTQVEADLGTFDEYEELDLDDVVPGPIALLSTCIEAYGEGQPATQ